LKLVNITAVAAMGPQGFTIAIIGLDDEGKVWSKTITAEHEGGWVCVGAPEKP
jgi:hypothetical protein